MIGDIYIDEYTSSSQKNWTAFTLCMFQVPLSGYIKIILFILIKAQFLSKIAK